MTVELALARETIEVERQIVDAIAAFVAELRESGAIPYVTPHESLERDLGIGSLERVELFLRLEQRFAVRLGERPWRTWRPSRT